MSRALQDRRQEWLAALERAVRQAAAEQPSRPPAVPGARPGPGSVSVRHTHLRRLRQQYQEHLAGLPSVIVLDDAASATQVRPLIPEHSPSLVLITSRRPLDLRGGSEVHTLRVDPLTSEETAALFDAQAGPLPHPPPDRVLQQASGGRPLAVLMAGATLAANPRMRLPEGDLSEETLVRLAYQALPSDTRRLLRRLVLVGRASLGASAAAALLECEEREAEQLLRTLSRTHMVEQVHQGRYRLHEMLRPFARDRLEAEDNPQERTAAQERLIHDYAQLAASVILKVKGASSARAARARVRGFDTLDAALRWLDEECSFVTLPSLKGGASALTVGVPVSAAVPDNFVGPVDRSVPAADARHGSSRRPGCA